MKNITLSLLIAIVTLSAPVAFSQQGVEKVKVEKADRKAAKAEAKALKAAAKAERKAAKAPEAPAPAPVQ